MYLSYSDIVCIVYGSIYGLGFIFIVAVTWKCSQGLKANVRAVLKMKSVFAPSIVGVYDTVTDTAVVVDFGQLWYYQTHCNGDASECNPNHINARLFFFAGLTFIALYRILKFAALVLSGIADGDKFYIWVGALGIVDLDSIYIAYTEIREYQTNNKEIGTGNALTTLKFLQLVEAVLEALPQLVLQSVYVMRYPTEGANQYLIIASIFGSLLSITTKFTWLDSTDELGDRQFTDNILSFDSEIVKCRLNILYFTRVFFRIFEITARMTIYALMWSVVGGPWLPLFTVLPLSIALFRYRRNAECDLRMWIRYLLYSFPAIVATTEVNTVNTVMNSIVDIVGMIIITPFVFTASPQCDNNQLCTDIDVRLWRNNRFVAIFVCIAYASIFGYLCTYCALYVAGVVAEDRYSGLEPVWQPQCCVNFTYVPPILGNEENADGDTKEKTEKEMKTTIEAGYPKTEIEMKQDA